MDEFLYLIYGLIVLAGGAGVVFLVWTQYRKFLQESKNYERGLKMVYLHIHLPPSSTDLESTGSSRDQRDLTDEILSQAQVMYSIIASTVYSGFKARLFGQRHLSFEIVAKDGLIYYYAVVPMSLIDIIKQAISTAYPSARIEEVEGKNIFQESANYNSICGGEFTLRKDPAYPILTYQESKQDVSRSLLNALSASKQGDGVAIQILIRPADDSWVDVAINTTKAMREGKKGGSKGLNIGYKPGELLEVLWKPPQSNEQKDDFKGPDEVDRMAIEAIENKIRYPGFETLVRVVVSSETSTRSQSILQNIIASFALLNSTNFNGFKYNQSKNIDELVTAYIMRFFPQSIKTNILNSVELATLFHLPSQKDIPTSQIKRQATKQVDGPTDLIEEGLLLGYNEFRGVKKPIRLSAKDRLRHTYFIGQTGTGKSGLLENLAYQDIMDGKGFAFVDPHGDSVERLLGMIPRNRVEDVIYFNPSDIDNPIGLNLFEFENEDQKDFLIQECIQMLYGLYDPGHTGIMGPRFETWFRNAALALMADPDGSSFIDVPKMFSDPDFMNYKMQFVTDMTVRDFWLKEMAMMPESAKGEILGWFASKFGAFLSNEMMRNIIGQTKSGFNMRQIMDNNKILLINLSKGRTGELNAKLLGMMFVMKFQAAAMSRADMPEAERKEFCLYVDEFQNFATESFESILSEARKYKLNLIVANQFMTQLTEKIREAIIGNVGTIIAGRIGITDAQILEKRFLPVFNAEDLTRLPNYQTITTVMINNTPSSPFSMNLLPPVGDSSDAVRDAIKRLSATRFGQSRAMIDAEIAKRLSAGSQQPNQQTQSMPGATIPEVLANHHLSAPSADQEESFLDGWLKKRRELKAQSQNNLDTMQASTNHPQASLTPPSSLDSPTVRVDTQASQSTGVVSTSRPMNEIKTKVTHLTSGSDDGSVNISQAKVMDIKPPLKPNNSLKIGSDDEQELDLRIK